MKVRRWSVIRCAGPEGELAWSVVHRQKPIFVAVVSDRSVDHLDEIPAGAIHWAKQASATDDILLMREALETIRSWRSGADEPPGQDTLERRSSRRDAPGRSRNGRRMGSDEETPE